MNLWDEALQNVVAFGVALGLAGVVALVLVALFPKIRGRFWPLQRLRRGYWTGLDVFVVFVIITQTTDMVRQLLESTGFYGAIFDRPPSFLRQLIWAYPLYFFLTLALIFVFLFMRTRTRPSHFGLTLARWPHCVVQGLLGFALITAPVLLVYFVAIVLFSHVPHELERLAAEGLRDIEWGLILFQTCVAAPVLEELFFRGLLQGWLRRASLVGHVMLCGFSLFVASMPLMASLNEAPNAPDLEVAWRPLAFAGLLVALYAWRFFSVWKGVLREGVFHLVEATPATQEKALSVQTDTDTAPQPIPAIGLHPLLRVDPERFAHFQAGNCRLAILGSAMFFAAAHSSAWPSPIALFPFGLVLGWLAYRTQSIVGTIVLHAFFNLTAFLTLLQS